MKRLVLIAPVVAGVMLAAPAGASTPNLQNVGGRTPASKVITVSPQTINGGRGVFAKTGPEKFSITITGGAGVSHAYCNEEEEYFCYMYEATATLTGNFTTVKSAFVPNRSGGSRRIIGTVDGKVSGSFTWEFYDQAYPYAKLAPGNVSSLNLQTIIWTFFGAGARHGGKGLTQASITYKANGCKQSWTVSASTNNGQAPNAGNIFGGKACA